MGLKAVGQKPDEFRGCVRLSLRGNVLRERMGRAFHQNAENLVWVGLARADHADHFGQDQSRVGSVRGDALDPSDERFDGGKGAVWHGASMAG